MSLIIFLVDGPPSLLFPACLVLDRPEYTDLVFILYVEGIELRVLEGPLCVVFNCHDDLDHGLVA